MLTSSYGQMELKWFKWNDSEVLSSSMFKWTNRLTNLGSFFQVQWHISLQVIEMENAKNSSKFDCCLA